MYCGLGLIALHAPLLCLLMNVCSLATGAPAVTIITSALSLLTCPRQGSVPIPTRAVALCVLGYIWKGLFKYIFMIVIISLYAAELDPLRSALLCCAVLGCPSSWVRRKEISQSWARAVAGGIIPTIISVLAGALQAEALQEPSALGGGGVEGVE